MLFEFYHTCGWAKHIGYFTPNKPFHYKYINTKKCTNNLLAHDAFSHVHIFIYIKLNNIEHCNKNRYHFCIHLF
jgi:hypothetical protein